MGEPGGAVVVAVDVRAGVEEAFGVFTAGIGDWWPVAAYSVEPGRVDAVMLEGRAGAGCTSGGSAAARRTGGQVLAWAPPARVLLARPIRTRRTAPGWSTPPTPPNTTGARSAARPRPGASGWSPMCTPSLAAPNRPCTTPVAAWSSPTVSRAWPTSTTPYAAEAMARALACAGDLDQAATWHSRATAAGATVADDEDRQIFTDDLATGPWFGLNRR
jgi:hypothetical protein